VMLSIQLGNDRHLDFTASSHRPTAAWMERAPARPVERTGDGSLDRDQSPPGSLAQPWHSTEKINRVRMFWIAQNLAYRSIFHDLPEVHDSNGIGNLGNDSQIMRDEHDSHPEVFLQAAHKVQDLSLDRHVKS